MKYLITESKLEETILTYINSLFNPEEIKYTNPYIPYDEGGNEDSRVIEFYFGDYFDGDDICFRWYDCTYFNPGSPASEICPTVSLEYKYERSLNGYFGDMWHEPFKRWFTKKFNLPIKTID
jgi:hypothetical protein